MIKTISILGSTGSVGLSTLEIIDKKKKLFKIIHLSANKNYDLICKQIIKYNPKYFIITNYKVFKKVKEKFKKRNIKILSEFDKVNLGKKINISVAAIPGVAGLEPTIKFIQMSKKILIANKESIICGWSIMKHHALKNKTIIVPVDSEHFSILKLLENQNLRDVEKIYITASGGPFLNYNKNQMKNISPREAINHPKWKMGKKISIDSSTLMNKILELIEAQKLFGIPSEKLDIIIHPNSLIHAIVKFKNGLTNFIYHETSMKIPLANAIFNSRLNMSDFYKSKKKKKHIENLSFQKVNKNIFPVITLKKRVNEYPSTSIIINAANEILVELFLMKKIPFLSISKTIMKILNDRNYKKYAIRKPKNIHEISEIDNWARKNILKKLNLND